MNAVTPGPPMFFNSGIRMLLHERAPEALHPGLEIPDLTKEFPEYRSWLPSHLLHVGLRSSLDVESRALFLSIIRRATHALAHYLTAREKTLRYASWNRSGAIPASDYFGSLEDWENCLLQFQILIEVLNKSIPPSGTWRAYSSGDGSATERMCEMSNRVKHSTRGQITAKQLTPLWLEREGLGALDGYSISYTELADELRGALSMAEDFVDPAELFKRLKRQGEAAGPKSGSDEMPSL